MSEEVINQNQQQQNIQLNQIPEFSCIIVDLPDSIPFYLKQFQQLHLKHFHIILINQDNYYPDPNVSTLKCNTFDEYARICYKIMFEKRLFYIITDNASELCLKVKDKTIELITLDREFCFGLGGLNSIDNFWNNLSSIINSQNTSMLKDKFIGKTAVLVNSGPSLNKNIDVLKKYKNKVVIFAASTAIGALHKANIIPDFLVMIDPFPMVKDFVLPYCTKETILLASSVTSHDLIKEYPGQVIYFYTNGGIQIVCDMAKDLNVTEGILTSATVTSAVLSLALWMNFQNIVFIGQDMCFEDNKVYADGVNGITDNLAFEVEGLDGMKHKTIASYKEIWNYFNSIVPKMVADGKNIFNCTEGGLGILGAEKMKLEEFMDFFINENDEDINIKDLLLIEQNSVIDKAKILSNICIIKNEVIKLQYFVNLFKQYIDNLIEKQVDENIIKSEIDDFIDRLKNKKAESYLDLFISWIWFLIVSINDLNEKMNSFITLNNVFDRFIGLLDKQFEVLSK